MRKQEYQISFWFATSEINLNTGKERNKILNISSLLNIVIKVPWDRGTHFFFLAWWYMVWKEKYTLQSCIEYIFVENYIKVLANIDK